MTVAIHVTHEAVRKYGGIGTVIYGLTNTETYQKTFRKTILYAPLFHREGNYKDRLGEQSEVLYSGLDRFDSGDLSKRFLPIEKEYGIQIVYGNKNIAYGLQNEKGTLVDVIAVDIWDMKQSLCDQFKYKLWEHFKISSDHYQHDRDYEQYLRIGVLLHSLLEEVCEPDERAVIFSHEYMGLGSALASVIEKREGRRKQDLTIFYAHEVSTARMVVENHPGHDLTFYNILRTDRDEGRSMEDEFGSYSYYSRSELIKRAIHLDYIFAVSDITKEEYLYLCPQADPHRIKVVYNGIPIEKTTFDQKEKSIHLMGNYCERLFNFYPDYIFTHVTRLIISKALWRDIRFLYHLDQQFEKNNIKGFFLILSTLVGDGRPANCVATMEAEYGWPVIHREDWPDLVGTEVDIYNQLKLFNARSKAIKGVFINQFGFDNPCCGTRVPDGATLFDLRLASDFEFGLSIYEPFGIAQLETLPYGGTPVISSVCGCASLLRDALDPKDYLSVDFTIVPEPHRDLFKTKSDFKNVSREVRDLVTSQICLDVSPELMKQLPKSKKERESRFKELQEKSELLDWEHVAERIAHYLKDEDVLD